MATQTRTRRNRSKPQSPRVLTPEEIANREAENEKAEKSRRERHAALLAERKAAAKTAGEEVGPDEDYEPLLSISVKRKKKDRREIVEIDGDWYELRLMSELGIADQQELNHDMTDFDELMNKKPLDSDEKQMLKILLDRMFDRVLIAPEQVKDLVTDDGDRHEIVKLFIYGPLQRLRQKELRELKEAAEAAQEIPESVTPDTSYAS